MSTSVLFLTQRGGRAFASGSFVVFFLKPPPVKCVSSCDSSIQSSEPRGQSELNVKCPSVWFLGTDCFRAPAFFDAREAAQLGSKKTRLQSISGPFKHNQPRCAAEPHRFPLQLPTQSHLIAHRVCVGQFPEGSRARRRRSLIPAPRLRETRCIQKLWAVGVYVFFCGFCFTVTTRRFCLFFIYSLFSPLPFPLSFTAAQVLLQAGDKSCDRDRRVRERQSGDAIPGYLFILHANAQVLNHLTSRFPDVPSVCLSFSLSSPQWNINKLFCLRSLFREANAPWPYRLHRPRCLNKQEKVFRKCSQCGLFFCSAGGDEWFVCIPRVLFIAALSRETRGCIHRGRIKEDKCGRTGETLSREGGIVVLIRNSVRGI